VAYRVTYSVSGNVPSGYSVPVDGTAYSAGSTVTAKPVPSIEGYSFSGWSLNGQTVASFSITRNVTLTGRFAILGTDKYVQRKIGGTYKRCIVRVDTGDTLKKTAPKVKDGQSWKST
jgi:hypothetical protein